MASLVRFNKIKKCYSLSYLLQNQYSKNVIFNFTIYDFKGGCHEIFDIFHDLNSINIALNIVILELAKLISDFKGVTDIISIFSFFVTKFKCQISQKIGYPISSDLPTHLYPILSDFREPTNPPNHRISYVDSP